MCTYVPVGYRPLSVLVPVLVGSRGLRVQCGLCTRLGLSFSQSVHFYRTCRTNGLENVKGRTHNPLMDFVHALHHPSPFSFEVVKAMMIDDRVPTRIGAMTKQ
jgi:hypothetical protein